MSLRGQRVAKKQRKRSRTGYANFYATGLHDDTKPVFKVTRKQLGLLLVAIIIAGIFAIGNYGGTIIPVVYGDYNTSFSHTRTPIFTDTLFTGVNPLLSFGSVTNGTSSASNPLVLSLSVTFNDAIIVAIFEPQPVTAFTVTDSQGNTYTQRAASPSVVGQTQFQTAIASSTGTDSITITTTAAPTWDGVAMNYHGQLGFGNTASSEYTAGTAGTGTDNLSLSASSTSFILEIFDAQSASFTCSAISVTPNNSQNSRSVYCPSGVHSIVSDVPATTGTNTVGYNFNFNPNSVCTTNANCFRHHSALELKGGAGGSPSTSSLTRWNYNTTCVTNFTGSNPGPGFKFDFSLGSAGSGGANCSSADIIISKSPANLQTAAGRMLEFVAGWFDNSGSQIANLTIALRTNSTLPSFTQNYNALSDVQARLVWTFTANYTGNGLQTVYVVRDQSHSVNTDGPINDLVIQGKFDTITKPNAQTVLNFTGPTNFMEAYGTSAATSSSNNTASSLQFGQDYYILAQATFTGTPGGSDNARFETIVAGGFGPNVSPFGIWSVPASCNDPVNKTPCALPTATPTFQFNPLDPSSWGNAIIKGLIWVFTVAVGQATFVVLQVILPLLIQTLNLIGNFFGLGNIGTDISTLLSNWVTFFTNQLPTAFNNLGTLFLRWFDSLTILFSWVPIALSIAGNLLSLGINGIGFVLLIVQDTFLLWDTMIVLMLILFWFADIGEYGLSGFQIWIETFKYLVFGLGMRPLLAAIHYGTDVILLMVGILPKPVIQIAAKFDTIIPSIDISGQPTWPSFTMEEVRKGNYFSVLGFLIGVIVLVWFETTSLPGSITALVPGVGVSLTRLAGIPNLLLVFLEIFGFMALFILPAQLFQSMGLGLSTPALGNLQFRRGPSVQVGSVGLRISRREPGRILKRAEKKIGKDLNAPKGSVGEKRMEQLTKQLGSENIN